MNAHAKFLLLFFASTMAAGVVAALSILEVPRYPLARFVPLLAIVALFVFIYLLMKRFRGQLPPATEDQLLRGARAARRTAWIYFGGLILGLTLRGREIFDLPLGLGYLTLFIPILLGTYYLRASTRLKRLAAETSAKN